MHKIASYIVDHRKMFMILMLIAAVVCGILSSQVKINNDQSKYLPEESDTFIGLNVMDEEFGTSGTMSVMIKDISLIEASNFRKELDKVDDVTSTVFLDTMLLTMKTDKNQPENEYIDTMFDMLSMVYKMQEDYFPDRSLGYVYKKLSDIANQVGDISVGGKMNIPEIITDNGIITGYSLAPQIERFGDGGQSISNIDSSSINMLEGYYKNKCALLSINFTYGDYDDETIVAIEKILKISPEYGEAYYTGQAATTYFNQKDMSNEMVIIAIMAVIIILGILFLATSSYVEPLLYAIVIIASIVLNMGTNIIFGEISSIANTVQALLQLALSIDYLVFLLHTFAAEKKNTPDKVQAMKNALSKTIITISSSSLTTIASFVAIMFMTFGIGLNFGLVMAKGIVFSLLSVFLLMPGITLGLDKALDRTSHRNPIEAIKEYRVKRLERLAKKNGTVYEKPISDKKPIKHGYLNVLYKSKSIIVIMFIAMMVPMYFCQANNSFFFGDAPEGTTSYKSIKDTAIIEDVFGMQNTGAIVISNDYLDKEESLCDILKQYSFVSSVTGYSMLLETMDEEDIPREMVEQFHNRNYYRIVVNFDFPVESERSFESVERIEQLLSTELGEDSDYFLLGATKSIYEIKNYSLSDQNLINGLTLAFILLILLITFRSLGLPLILGVIIQGATWLNMAIPFLMGNEMSFLGYMIVSGIQMGSTIDYGILLTNNYLEERKRHGKKEAMQIAFKKSFGAILMSGSILTTVGLVLGFISSNPSTQMLGTSLGLGALISTLSMFIILPPALTLLDKFISKTTIGGKKTMIDEKKLEKEITNQTESQPIQLGE